MGGDEGRQRVAEAFADLGALTEADHGDLFPANVGVFGGHSVPR